MAPFRLLLLEDSADDADLLAIELDRAGLAAEIRRVGTRDAYAAALTGFAPDIVVSDYDLPGFSGGEALAMARTHDPALPFLVLSGFVAEDRPADDRARGADAWVCKDRMHEMPAALRRLLAR
ncbi:MAG TPA: response regulator [Luteimonas sp.]|jgi:CheY-like chemotaxis protein|nr:response regulator [Luteimonas sp.]